MAKPINILHPIPKPPKNGIAIVPCGLYCNRELQNAPEFTFMLRCVYGERMTIAKLFEQWEAWAVVEGIGSAGFSRDEALVVEVSNLE